jgi:hypothetical protein
MKELSNIEKFNLLMYQYTTELHLGFKNGRMHSIAEIMDNMPPILATDMEYVR